MAIAPTYDVMNVVMSAGCIHLWHRAFRRHTGLDAGDRALDVCTATGELARIMAGQVGPGGQVVALDLTPEMLAVARRKLAGAGLDRVVTLVEGNALRLPFPDASFKAASIGFALRNVADIRRVIVRRPASCGRRTSSTSTASSRSWAAWSTALQGTSARCGRTRTSRPRWSSSPTRRPWPASSARRDSSTSATTA